MISANESSTALSEELSNVVQRVQRSLVVIHNGWRGAGAGVVWRPGGLIVTNYHVVGRGQARVTLPDGRQFPARRVTQEPKIDLLLLQIDESDLSAALIADSRDLRVGQIVLAVGHPWGQRGMVTAGIITSLGEVGVRGRLGRQRVHDPVPVIRSDVTLAPGNSGGPLVNAVGGVVGINTMIVGGDLGLAIPSHVVSAFVDRAVGERVGIGM